MHFVILLIMVVLIAFFMQRILGFLVAIHFFYVFYSVQIRHPIQINQIVSLI